jgi:hypothetical protein
MELEAEEIPNMMREIIRGGKWNISKVSLRKLQLTLSYAFSRSSLKTISPFFFLDLLMECSTSCKTIALSLVLLPGMKLFCKGLIIPSKKGLNLATIIFEINL